MKIEVLGRSIGKISKTEYALRRSIDHLIDNDAPSFRPDKGYDYMLVCVTKQYSSLFKSHYLLKKGRWSYYVYRDKTVYLKRVAI